MPKEFLLLADAEKTLDKVNRAIEVVSLFDQTLDRLQSNIQGNTGLIPSEKLKRFSIDSFADGPGRRAAAVLNGQARKKINEKSLPILTDHSNRLKSALELDSITDFDSLEQLVKQGVMRQERLNMLKAEHQEEVQILLRQAQPIIPQPLKVENKLDDSSEELSRSRNQALRAIMEGKDAEEVIKLLGKTKAHRDYTWIQAANAMRNTVVFMLNMERKSQLSSEKREVLEEIREFTKRKFDIQGRVTLGSFIEYTREYLRPGEKFAKSEKEIIEEAVDSQKKNESIIDLQLLTRSHVALVIAGLNIRKREFASRGIVPIPDRLADSISSGISLEVSQLPPKERNQRIAELRKEAMTIVKAVFASGLVEEYYEKYAGTIMGDLLEYLSENEDALNLIEEIITETGSIKVYSGGDGWVTGVGYGTYKERYLPPKVVEKAIPVVEEPVLNTEKDQNYFTQDELEAIRVSRLGQTEIQDSELNKKIEEVFEKLDLYYDNGDINKVYEFFENGDIGSFILGWISLKENQAQMEEQVDIDIREGTSSEATNTDFRYGIERSLRDLRGYVQSNIRLYGTRIDSSPVSVHIATQLTEQFAGGEVITATAFNRSASRGLIRPFVGRDGRHPVYNLEEFVLAMCYKHYGYSRMNLSNGFMDDLKKLVEEESQDWRRLQNG